MGSRPDPTIGSERTWRVLGDGADPATEKQVGHADSDKTVQALYELYRSRKEKVLRSWSECGASWGA